MPYNGSIELISGIVQANNGTFPLVEAGAVQVDDSDKRLNTALEELNSLINEINVLLGNSSVSDQIAQTIDPTLSISGASAEAKVTGDEISALRAKLFVGTYAEFQTALADGKVAIGAIVIITDDGNGTGGSGSGGNTGSGDSESGDDSGEDAEISTTSALGEAVLGYMKLG